MDLESVLSTAAVEARKQVSTHEPARRLSPTFSPTCMPVHSVYVVVSGRHGGNQEDNWIALPEIWITFPETWVKLPEIWITLPVTGAPANLGCDLSFHCHRCGKATKG